MLINWTEILSSLIGAFGVIIAAIIGAGLVNNVIRRSFMSGFYSYSEKNKDVWKIIRTAQHDLYIVVNCGNNFLSKYKKHLEKLLKRGVNVNLLILNKSGYFVMDNYVIKGVDNVVPDYSGVSETIGILEELHPYIGNHLFIRTFPSIFTASYIAVDIEEKNSGYRRNAIIQIMLYQYLVKTESAPTVCLTPKEAPEHFASTADSILNMWNDSIYSQTPLSYLKEQYADTGNS